MTFLDGRAVAGRVEVVAAEAFLLGDARDCEGGARRVEASDGFS